MCERRPLREGLEKTHVETWGWTGKDEDIDSSPRKYSDGRVSAWCSSSKSRTSRRRFIWTVDDSRSPWTNFTIYPVEYNTRQQIEDNESGWQGRYWSKEGKDKEYERNASLTQF